MVVLMIFTVIVKFFYKRIQKTLCIFGKFIVNLLLCILKVWLKNFSTMQDFEKNVILNSFYIIYHRIGLLSLYIIFINILNYKYLIFVNVIN